MTTLATHATVSPLQLRWKPFGLAALHVGVSAAIAAGFAHWFGRSYLPIAGHTVVIAQWDLVLLASIAAAFVTLPARRARVARVACRLLPAATLTLQTYLYMLDLISNLSWGRNASSRLVASFAPTVWSGREPFPVGPLGIGAFLAGTFLVMLALSPAWGTRLEAGVGAWAHAWSGSRRGRLLRGVAACGVVAATGALFTSTLHAGIRSDALPWKTELVSSFFRRDTPAYEPTARRLAVAERDALLRATYPHGSAPTPRHVILIIVDSLRADRMQVYGYPRPTTPFLARLVAGGRMQKVEAAFSTCSESFCGITSTLASREFRDISPRAFQLQDVLHDRGYRTWFLLSGNHRAWNGLPQFYHASDDELFDGSQTRRYTMDDDRLTLEGLERVPPASGEPAFFYVHLMSTHYLGVQLPTSHFFTRPDDIVSPGAEPFRIRHQLNKPDRYDDKVRQADDIIRQLFEALTAKGYLDRATVIVTADHGEGLGERHWSHGWHLYNEDIRIPLLLYDTAPVQYGNLEFATQVDVAPTILERLGLPVPASWQGRSLLDSGAKTLSVHQTYFVPNRFAVLSRTTEGFFKYIETPAYGEVELYDLRRDPGEARNIAGDRPRLTERLQRTVHAYRTE